MRRFAIVFATLFVGGCSSHSAVPAPAKVAPEVFQRHPLVNGFAVMQIPPINGQTTSPGPITMDNNHKMWVVVSTSDGKNYLERIAMDQKVTAVFPLSISAGAMVLGPDNNL